MAARERVKLLIPIWGARYVEEFARIAMPFHLAEGNLPFLAAETDLEVLFLTTESSQTSLNEDSALNRLGQICPVRFIFIDDLIAKQNYGVILTLAYARGIADSGADQTNTFFVFMNADFILADGSMRELVAQVKAGHRCVMAPSLRACTENVLEPLGRVAGADGIARMTSRDMVALALSAPHPTVVGKTVTQNLVSSIHYNQIYWQVDEKTLLARYHLIFMLMIRPEVPIGSINSYCDYGFVPELVPSGKFHTLADSDAFFMLELQPIAQEQNLVRVGTALPRDMGAELSTWTTAEHRRFAKVDIVFHTGDLPAALPDARRRFAAFMSDVQDAMTPEAVSHIDHFYWTGGVLSWLALKSFDKDQDIVLPPELGHPAYIERRPPPSEVVSPANIEPDPAPLRPTAFRRLKDIYIPRLARLPRQFVRRPVIAPIPAEPFDFGLRRMWIAFRLQERAEARRLADELRGRNPSHPEPHIVNAISGEQTPPFLAVSPLLSFRIEARAPATSKELTCLWNGEPLSEVHTPEDGYFAYARPGRWDGDPSWVSRLEFADRSGTIVNDVSARIVVDLMGVTDPVTGDMALSPENLHRAEYDEAGQLSHRWTGPGNIAAIQIPMWIQVEGVCSLRIVHTGQNAMEDIITDVNGGVNVLRSDHPGWIDESTIELPVPVEREGCCAVRLRTPRTANMGLDTRELGIAWARVRLSFPLPRRSDVQGASRGYRADQAPLAVLHLLSL